MIKDKDFYNKESEKYSSKRYPENASSYIQFFFKKRLNLVLNMLKKVLDDRKELKLLEIGCADGVVLREVVSKMDNSFSQIVGIDIAERMIDTARLFNKSLKTTYFVRGSEAFSEKFDLVLELGVINYTDFEKDLKYVLDNLNINGFYILSVAGKDSLNNFFQGGDNQYQNLLSYKEYEDIIKKYFIIKKIIPCGFYIPFLWRLPSLARILQTIFEEMFFFLPNLYHEKIYFLEKK